MLRTFFKFPLAAGHTSVVRYRKIKGCLMHKYSRRGKDYEISRKASAWNDFVDNNESNFQLVACDETPVCTYTDQRVGRAVHKRE